MSENASSTIAHVEHSHDSKDNTAINGTKLQILGTLIMAPGSVLGDAERQTPTSHHLPWPLTQLQHSTLSTSQFNMAEVLHLAFDYAMLKLLTSR